jgi:branched-chain amino acid transport system permease protein
MIAFLLFSLIAPFVLPQYWTTFLFIFFIFATLAQMWNFIAGYCGLISLGQQAFIGVGGYMVAICVTLWRLPIWSGILLGGVAAAILALATSFLIARMTGLYFAAGTLILALAIHYLFYSWTYVGGGYGITIYSGLLATELYYISLCILIFATLIVHVVLKSDVGLKMKAIRDDASAAEAYGVNVFRVKLLCWVISAFLTGLAGGVFLTHIFFITPSLAFSFEWLLVILVATLFGGGGTIEGPLVGAFVATLLREYLFAGLPGFSNLVYGLLIIVVLTVAPRGIIGLLQSKVRLRKS